MDSLMTVDTHMHTYTQTPTFMANISPSIEGKKKYKPCASSGIYPNNVRLV